ncbi:hypothetical protein TNCT_332661 [Trichonephila clavata]|uniref:Uncharacterized protein n=1 Tax=Trichonephila clavata TaxID=2740835 RepID=A0A8X6HWK5_TRICU|nr:hypothetical protein TNCT_332661 [Trichonephila clavata]
MSNVQWNKWFHSCSIQSLKGGGTSNLHTHAKSNISIVLLLGAYLDQRQLRQQLVRDEDVIWVHCSRAHNAASPKGKCFYKRLRESQHGLPHKEVTMISDRDYGSLPLNRPFLQ